MMDGWTWKPAVLTVAPIAGFFALLALAVGATTKPSPTYPLIRDCRHGDIVRVNGARFFENGRSLTPIDPEASLDDICRRQGR